jgi:hypothetical protein
MALLGGMAGRIGSAGKTMGRGAARFAGHQGGKSFSTMGKMRMGAAAGGAIGMSLRNNQKRGAYNPSSSATGGLQPKSSGGMGVGQF